MNDDGLIKERYCIKHTLGQGGFATTYLALDMETSKPCVVKYVSLKGADTFKTLELFEREAKILANLNHPLIPRLIDFFTVETDQDQQIYLVEEYIEGQTVAQLIEAGRHFTEKEAINLALAITRVLEHIHGFSPPLIHRDIKPSNVVITPNQKVYLVDFGAVRDKVLGTRTTQGAGSTIVGTYGYMPFEQFEGRAVPASDIYALGATLVYVLSHKEPHQMERDGMRLDFRPHVNISTGCAKVLDRMLQANWQQRYHAAGELRADLQGLLAGQEPVMVVTRSRWWMVGIASVVTGLLTIGGLTTFVYFRTSAVPNEPAKGIAVTGGAGATVRVGGWALMANGQLAQGFKYTGSCPVNLKFDWGVLSTEPTTITYTFVRSDGGHLNAPRTATLPNANQSVSIYDDWQLGANTSRFQNFSGWVQLNIESPNRVYQKINFTIQCEQLVRNEPANPTMSGPDLTIPMQHIIHLTLPRNTGSSVLPIHSCDDIQFSTPVRFAWEPVETGVDYDYEIFRRGCPFMQDVVGNDKVAMGSTKVTRMTLMLPPNRENEIYEFHLTARKGGRKVGQLLTHSSNGGVRYDLPLKVRS